MRILLDQLTWKYSSQDRPALDRLSFEGEVGSTVAIVGKSSIGKSTLIALLAGMYTPRNEESGTLTGRIMIDGKKPWENRGPSAVSWVPQNPTLLDHLNVLQNVMLPVQLVSCDRHSEEEKAASLLREIGLEGIEKKRPAELSGGMKARVSFLRALITKPTYLFLDEPFSGLDLSNRWNLYKMLHKNRGEGKFVTVLATHDIDEAVLLADSVLCVEQDRDGAPTTISRLDWPAGSLNNLSDEMAFVAVRMRAAAIARRLLFGESGSIAEDWRPLVMGT
jgi:ABC-type nitrate/sulfonate/bicarbonate transport system ATPase subunit